MNKLQKFADLLTFPHVYENFSVKEDFLVGQHGVELQMKGKWNSDHFKNDQPITLELACGRGEYSVALGRMYPDRNFIGLDIKGARIWKGAKEALEEGLDNVAFLRCRIEMIHRFFEEDEVDEIWIIFPDPFLREGKSNRRLTSPRFLNQYKKLLKKGGIIHLKTDSPPLYEFTLESAEADSEIELLYHDDNIYNKELVMPELAFKTYYEHMHLEDNRLIKYVRMRLKDR